MGESDHRVNSGIAVVEEVGAAGRNRNWCESEMPQAYNRSAAAGEEKGTVEPDLYGGGIEGNDATSVVKLPHRQQRGGGEGGDNVDASGGKWEIRNIDFGLVS